MSRTFEQMLIEKYGINLMEVARSNARYHFDNLNECSEDFIREKFLTRARLHYPSFEKAPSRFRNVFTSIFYPGGCDADCDICFTGVNKRKPSPFDMTPDEFLRFLEKLPGLGNIAVRWIGIGEPMLIPYLPDFIRRTRELGMTTIIFTNGLTLPKKIKDEFATGLVDVYYKGWADNATILDQMVRPKHDAYHLMDGKFGLATKSFYELVEIDETRVGFEVCFDQRYFEYQLAVIHGPKSQLPLLIEPTIDIQGIPESVPKQMPIETLACSKPARGMYYTYALLAHARDIKPLALLHGTFLWHNAISFEVETFEKIRPIAPLLNPFHFKAAYPESILSVCHCRGEGQQEVL